MYWYRIDFALMNRFGFKLQLLKVLQYRCSSSKFHIQTPPGYAKFGTKTEHTQFFELLENLDKFSILVLGSLAIKKAPRFKFKL